MFQLNEESHIFNSNKSSLLFPSSNTSNVLLMEVWFKICIVSFETNQLEKFHDQDRDIEHFEILKTISLSHEFLPSLFQKSLSAHFSSKESNNNNININSLGEMEQITRKESSSEIIVFDDSENDLLKIKWSNGNSLTIGKNCGRILSWNTFDVENLLSPLDICFWRAPTDNDRYFILKITFAILIDCEFYHNILFI